MTTEAIHAPDCAATIVSGHFTHGCGGTYTCPLCEREFGWCIGAYDDTPALCDECANAIQFEQEPCDVCTNGGHLWSSGPR
jgi:hypothetical protein